MIALAVARLLLTRLRTRRDGLWNMVFMVGTALAGLSVGLVPWLTATAAFGLPLAVSWGWQASEERRGLALLCARHSGAMNRLAAAEILIPALAGVIPGVLAVLTAGRVPWQIWLVLPFTSLTAGSAGYLLERTAPRAGAVLMALYWVWSFLGLRAEPGLGSLLFVPGHPAWVMAQRTGAPHSDGFVAVSAVLALGIVYLFFRGNTKASP